MNQYPYENLTDEEFENLVIRIGKEILGIGCKTFSVGKDGAKDSWFTGKQNIFLPKLHRGQELLIFKQSTRKFKMPVALTTIFLLINQVFCQKKLHDSKR
jgi:hypothetical protein